MIKKQFSYFLTKALCLSFLSGFLVACGGGGSDSNTVLESPTNLTGVAAAGAPIIGTVTVKGALGNTKSVLIEANGVYDVDVTGLAAPYRLRAEGTVGGRTYKLHSYAVKVDLGNTVNITPFTDLIIANAANQLAEAFFDSNIQTELDQEDVKTQEVELRIKLQNILKAVGVSDTLNLLNTAFSADHSGLDAALDIVSVEVDVQTNIATIRNILEPQNTITDLLTFSGETDVLVVDDPTVVQNSLTDIQQIAALFSNITAAYANGLPTGDAATAVSDYFADDFIADDRSKAIYLTDTLTSPNSVGLMFGGVTVNNLDIAAGTSEVFFYYGKNGVFNLEPVKWLVVKHSTRGWLIRGDQRIAATKFGFHCNDGDSAQNISNLSAFPGVCGINIGIEDNDFSNNGTTNDAPIASATVSIIDGADGVTIKDVIYLGTPARGTAGELHIYNEANGEYQFDWKGFGTGIGEINPADFVVGDIIEYSLYIEDLDTAIQTSPAVVGSPVETYRDIALFAPGLTAKYPKATAATLTDMRNFKLGDSLTVAWDLVQGTRINEVLIRISDSEGNAIELRNEFSDIMASSESYESNLLDAAAALTAGLSSTASEYVLDIRLYAVDLKTGQEHSTDYSVIIPGAVTPPIYAGDECLVSYNYNGSPYSSICYQNLPASVACANTGILATDLSQVDNLITSTYQWVDDCSGANSVVDAALLDGSGDTTGDFGTVVLYGADTRYIGNRIIPISGSSVDVNKNGATVAGSITWSSENNNTAADSNTGMLSIAGDNNPGASILLNFSGYGIIPGTSTYQSYFFSYALDCYESAENIIDFNSECNDFSINQFTKSMIFRGVTLQVNPFDADFPYINRAVAPITIHGTLYWE